MATEVLNKFTKSQLYQMVRQEGLKGDEDDNKKDLVESLRECIEEIGINQVTSAIKKDDLDALIGPLKIELPSQNDKEKKQTVSKAIIRKRISTLVAEEGLSKFFSDMDAKLLMHFYEASPTDEDAEEGKKKLAPQVARLVAEAGLQVFFGRFNVEFLQDLMESCKLKYNTNNLNALCLALAYQQPALKEKKKVAKSPKFSSKKLPIEKGITYQDIFQHYYSEDLHEYCKEHELKNSGTKKELINRILAFVNDDDMTTKVGAKRASSPKRKRSSSASKKTKKSTKKEKETEEKEKSDEKTEASPKKTEKKSTKKTKKEEKDEKDDE
eukprot:TRINITY_DN530_c0_g1_i1.p2 TRINITY_DN530_c0_g1~~TRINITY_DN530_c0_g1_i1.p2  ORF type:complete len:326 (-),score=124.62 TRINITY_DN530_c0_g1_i1:211-1188(-)